MRISDLRLLYEYNDWANGRILDAAARVPSDMFTTASLGPCALRDTLQHMLVAASIWRLRWQGIAPESVPFPDAFPTLESLRVQWREEARQMSAYLDTLDDADLDRELTYRRNDGTTDSSTLWHMLLQVVNHGTQHRSELAMLLTELGHSPGNLDVLVFIRERNAQSS